mgnify:FL=1
MNDRVCLNQQRMNWLIFFKEYSNLLKDIYTTEEKYLEKNENVFIDIFKIINENINLPKDTSSYHYIIKKLFEVDNFQKLFYDSFIKHLYLRIGRGNTLSIIPLNYINYEVYIALIKIDPNIINDVPIKFRNKNLCLEAVKNNKYYLQIDCNFEKDEDFYYKAMIRNSDIVIEDIPEMYHDEVVRTLWDINC